jgi:hypothetical protein
MLVKCQGSIDEKLEKCTNFTEFITTDPDAIGDRDKLMNEISQNITKYKYDVSSYLSWISSSEGRAEAAINFGNVLGENLGLRVQATYAALSGIPPQNF